MIIGLAVVLAACGERVDSAPAVEGPDAAGTGAMAGLPIEELGACYIEFHPGDMDDPMLLDEILFYVREWSVIHPGAILEQVRELESDHYGSHVFVTIAATPPGGSTADAVRFTAADVVVARMNDALAAGAEVFVGVNEVDRPTGAVAATDGESVAFLAHCGYEFSELLNEYAYQEDVTPAAAFEMLREPEGYRRLAPILYPGGVEWEDLHPDDRQLDPELTPPDVLARTVSFDLLFDLPPERAESTGLCARTEIAWSSCIDLAIADPALLSTYAIPGEDLEIWLIDEQEGFDPVARVGVLDQELVADAVDGGLVVYSTADVPVHADQIDDQTDLLNFDLISLEEAEAIVER